MKRNIMLIMSLIVGLFYSSLTAKTNEAQLKIVAEDFIEAFNTDDGSVREQFLKNHYLNSDSASAIERWLGHLSRYSQEFGKVEIHSIDLSDQKTLNVLMHISNQRMMSTWINLRIIMDADKSDKIISFGLDLTTDPNISLPDHQLTTDEISKFMSDFTDDLVARNVFSGAVSLVKDGKPFYENVYGKANLRWNIPNKLDTKFNLGSMNKMFTGVAICQLAEQGKIAFDDPMSKYLPDFPNKKISEKITIHHLLTHTSGMGSYWEAMAKIDWTKLRSVKDYADLTLNDSLNFEPGERFYYSNSGPLYLGLIIEAVSGMDYHDYIRKYVTDPAGMINTGCYNVDDIIPNLAQGYYWDDDIKGLRSNIYEHSARGSAAGGGFSTVEDLQNFAKALYNGTLLSAQMLETYTTGKVDMGPDSKYAYLIGDDKINGHRTVGHNGGAPGISADLKIFTDLGYSVTAMSNYDGGAHAITRYAMKLITHKRAVAE